MEDSVKDQKKKNGRQKVNTEKNGRFCERIVEIHKSKKMGDIELIICTIQEPIKIG